MKTKEQLLKEKKEIDAQLRDIELKDEYIEVSELNIKITRTQKFNNKKYSEILEEIDESEIVTHEILEKLRNISFDSKWKKYPFMKDFWVFVPNFDKASAASGRVARFYANSGRVDVGSDFYSNYRNSDLGVFLYKKLERDYENKKSK